MSAPRQILPGKTYLLTRRCIQRQFLLTPSLLEINEVFLFCLAHAATKYKIEIHAAVCLGTHFHLVATDCEGRLPDFMGWLDEFLAKCINVARGRWGELWDSAGYSGVELVGSDDVLEKILYTLANPVEAGLVPRGDEWPGFRSEIEDIGTREYVAKRPRFFSPKGRLPEEAKLMFVKPEQFAHMSDEEYRTLVEGKYSAREQAIRDRFRKEGRKLLGVRKVRMQDPYGTPSSHEDRRTMNTRIACKRKWPRIAAIERLATFRRRYREALEKYLAGDHDVVFPEGTWKMRVLFGVRCHSPP